MGGGLTQLVLQGQMDSYINISPCINYYKYVYNKHVNFSMENIHLPADSNSSVSLDNEALNTIINFTIKRYGDLVSNIYISFNLPDIFSTDTHRFRWIKNVGHIFIKRATITLGGTTLDEIYGDWMNVWNELTTKDDYEYNKLVGNIPEYVSPNNNNTRYIIRNNVLYNNIYPTSDKVRDALNPSIKGRRLQVPLNFWFTRNPSLALPLYKLMTQDLKIEIEVVSVEKLYQVWCDKLKLYVAPVFYNSIYGASNSITIATFVNRGSFINCELDVNYIFLDSNYRSSSLISGNIKYVVDYVKVDKNAMPITANGTDFPLTSSYNHIKELIWVLRRTDIEINFNIYDNYTASHVYNENMGILDTAQIKWAKTITRTDEDAYYYNNIQPYQHHTNIPRTGIYCYSFSLFPEKIVAAGSYNNQMIDTSLFINIKNKGNQDSQKDITKRKEYTYLFELMRRQGVDYKTTNETNVNFDIIIYSKVINVFSIVVGGGGNFMWSR